MDLIIMQTDGWSFKFKWKDWPKQVRVTDRDSTNFYMNENLENMNVSIHKMKFSFEKIMTDIKDSNLEIIGQAKIEINSVVKEGI